jgi:8-oxo-dGTP diphosphatase
MLLTDQSGRLAVVKPTYKPLYELPGGAVEDDESPREAAAREIAEELHLERAPGRLLAVDYVSAASSSAGTEGLVVVFDGGTVTDPDALHIPPDELCELLFVDPDKIDRYLPPLQTRRAIAALQARVANYAVYLEDGHPAPNCK